MIGTSPPEAWIRASSTGFQLPKPDQLLYSNRKVSESLRPWPAPGAHQACGPSTMVATRQRSGNGTCTRKTPARLCCKSQLTGMGEANHTPTPIQRSKPIKPMDMPHPWDLRALQMSCCLAVLIWLIWPIWLIWLIWHLHYTSSVGQLCLTLLPAVSAMSCVDGATLVNLVTASCWACHIGSLSTVVLNSSACFHWRCYCQHNWCSARLQKMDKYARSECICICIYMHQNPRTVWLHFVASHSHPDLEAWARRSSKESIQLKNLQHPSTNWPLIFY